MATIRCVVCGHFIAYSQMGDGGGARFYFRPDSHYGPEISEWTCEKCVIRENEDCKREDRSWRAL